MSSAMRHAVRYLIVRRWPVHVLLMAAYGYAVFAITHQWHSTAMVYYVAAMLGLFRVEEATSLTGRAMLVLPLSMAQRIRLLWGWIFLAPLAVMSGWLAVAGLISGVFYGFSIERSGLVALYIVAPFTVSLLAALLPRNRATGAARMIAVMAFFVAATADLIHDQTSAAMLSISGVLLALGLTFPLWGPRIEGRHERKRLGRRGSLVHAWPTGVFAMIWSRVRATLPSLLVAAGFTAIMVFMRGLTPSSGHFIGVLAVVMMGYVWLSNWRWLCHFRALRCLPLSSVGLTLLTIGASVVPSTTVWLIQYVVTIVWFGESALTLTSLIALLASQIITVPVFLYSPGWIRQGLPAAILPTVFLTIQSVAAATGLKAVQPLIASFAPIWIATFIVALAVCAVVAIAWTYREITHGHHAYRIQTDDWSPPAWVWID